MKTKRIFLSLLLVLSLVFVGCQQKPAENKDSKPTTNTEKKDNKVAEKKKVVTATTTFVEDMVKVVAGDMVDVQLVIPAGEDPHLYVAKPEDLKKVQEADLVLYHGLHFEGKMVEILEKTGKAISKNFDSKNLHEMEEDGVKSVDPHFWFDLKLYKQAVEEVKTQLVALLPDQKDALESNYTKYVAELEKLDKEIKEKLALIPEGSRYLITPHDAFNYFAHSYGMEVMAPQGISTDGEVANKEIEETAKFIADKKVKAIFAETTTNPERMKKLQDVVKSKGFDVKVVSGEGNELFSDSLAPKGEKGDNFLDMYRHNVDLIVKNLK